MLSTATASHELSRRIIPEIDMYPSCSVNIISESNKMPLDEKDEEDEAKLPSSIGIQIEAKYSSAPRISFCGGNTSPTAATKTRRPRTAGYVVKHPGPGQYDNIGGKKMDLVMPPSLFCRPLKRCIAAFDQVQYSFIREILSGEEGAVFGEAA